jgi:excisionase family DNA binding protein
LSKSSVSKWLRQPETAGFESFSQKCGKVEAMKEQVLTGDDRPQDLWRLLVQEQKLLTADELAKILNTTTRTIYRLCEQGLPYVKMGSALRFDPLKVGAWLEDHHHRDKA